MNPFQAKYPAFYALIGLVADAAKDTVAAAQGSGSFLQKLIGYETLVPELIALVPLAGQLTAEAQAMSVVDMEAAAEVLVSDLAFSSAKAMAVIAAALPLAEQLAALVAPSEALVAAIKA